MTSDPRIGVAVIGTGIGRLHVDAIASMHDIATLEYVCSTSINKAMEVASRAGAGTATDSFEEVLSDTSVDAVILCTPPHNHLQLATQAFQAGKHVLVEKPLAQTVEQAKQIIEAASANGKQLMVGHNQRYYRHYQEMKSILDSGLIGNPALLDSKVHVYGAINGFRTSHALAGGGTLIDSGVHKFDMFRWLLGDVESVFASGGNYIQEQMDDEDMAVVHLTFKSGVVGSFVCSWSSMTERSSESVSLFGPNGSIQAEDHSLRTERFVGRPGEAGAELRVDADVSDNQARTIVRMDEAFVRAIRDGAQVPITGHDGLMSLAIVEAAYRSIEQQTSIRLDDVLA